MGPRTAPRRLRDPGLASVEFLLASALGLILFVLLSNVVVVQYGRSAVDAAVNQAVRAGSLFGLAEDCEEKAAEVIGQLLGGAMGDGVIVDCSRSGPWIVAEGSAHFESWLPVQPGFRFRSLARAVVEAGP